MTWKLSVVVKFRPDDDVDNPLAEVSYSEAIKIEPDFEIGEELLEEVNIYDFGRRAI